MLKLKDFRPYKREVYYYETDKMGIVHHSNYIRIFEETRIDFLRQVGSPFETIEAKGLMMPVLSVECRYRHPLRFGNEFAVYAEIIKFNGTTLHISYTVKNTATGDICATGNSSHCFTDMELKPVRTKSNYPDVYAVFSDYIGVPPTEE